MALVKVSIDIFRIGNKLSNNKIKEIIELEKGQILTNKNIFDSKDFIHIYY